MAVVFFVLRLTVFAGVIYGSLKCFQGSVVALLCGLGLAVLAIGLGSAPLAQRLRTSSAARTGSRKIQVFMPESLALTRLLNSLFGGACGRNSPRVGIHPANAAAPINDAFALELLVAAGLIVFFIVVRLTLSVEKPNPAQQIAEMIHEFTAARPSRSSATATSASRPS